MFGSATVLESGDNAESTPQSCPEGISRGNDLPPDIEFTDSEYDSLCNSFRAVSILGYFVRWVPLSSIIQNWIQEVWEP